MHNKEKQRQQCRYTLHTQTHTMHNSQEFSSAAYTTGFSIMRERHRSDITPDSYDGLQFTNSGAVCHRHTVYSSTAAQNARHERYKYSGYLDPSFDLHKLAASTEQRRATDQTRRTPTIRMHARARAQRVRDVCACWPTGVVTTITSYL